MSLRVALLLSLLGWGCGDGCGADPAAAGTGTTKPLRCGDYLAVEELKALGLDPSRFNPDESERDPVLGVRCELGGKMSATLFRAALYAPMVADLDTAVSTGQIQRHPGPTIGAETHWTWLGKLHGMLFLASSKRFAVSLAGRDQGLIERVAYRLDAKLK